MSPGAVDHRADRAEVVRLLAMVHGQPLDVRLGALSAYLVGRPYLDRPLVGGPDEPERLVSRLDGFDCVTYVESVWALASASGPAEFEPALVALRYHQGRVEWSARNHYISQWLERNRQAGRVETVCAEPLVALERARTLAALPDYPAVDWTPRGLPRARVAELTGVARTGDLVGFVSTRGDLDTFHIGLLVAGTPVAGTPRMRLRHAGRSAGRVVDEPLDEFLGRNETPGLLLGRLLAPTAGEGERR